MMMKTLGIFLSVVFMIVPYGYAKDLELRQKAGEYEVAMKIDRNPPILGPNNMEIVIKDAVAGSRITDAEVTVNYYMPPMPRMAPMNYTTNAELKKETYIATMELIMAGPWVIRVMIMRAGKRVTAKFNVDAQ